MKKSKKRLLSLFLLTSIFINSFTSSLYANSISQVENANILESGYTSNGVYYEVSIDTVDSANTKAYPISSKNVSILISVSNLPSQNYNFNETYYYSDGTFSGTLYAQRSTEKYYLEYDNTYRGSMIYKGTVYSYD